ncbi:hypothetical protein [Caldivirga sp.]|uniref:hypothetical protein n=1 Tax=Caldivirga sp. TaxID=2080243 RepID=UPI0025B929DF|nr:hypothetical protein [Caldivirga sp.]
MRLAINAVPIVDTPIGRVRLDCNCLFYVMRVRGVEVYAVLEYGNEDIMHYTTNLRNAVVFMLRRLIDEEALASKYGLKAETLIKCIKKGECKPSYQATP